MIVREREFRRSASWRARTVRALLAAALLAVPGAARAEHFEGGIKYTKACPGQGHSHYFDQFALDIEPGQSVGWVTIFGNGFGVLTDWMVDGRWGYFAASAQDPGFGAIIFHGWIRDGRMKGYVSQHELNSGCVLYGKLKAWN